LLSIPNIPWNLPLEKLQFLEVLMKPTDQSQNWQAFYDSARYNKVLDPRTTLMLHLATAMAVGCYP
jgi:hypothetical protein